MQITWLLGIHWIIKRDNQIYYSGWVLEYYVLYYRFNVNQIINYQILIFPILVASPSNTFSRKIEQAQSNIEKKNTNYLTTSKCKPLKEISTVNSTCGSQSSVVKGNKSTIFTTCNVSKVIRILDTF